MAFNTAVKTWNSAFANTRKQILRDLLINCEARIRYGLQYLEKESDRLRQTHKSKPVRDIKYSDKGEEN